MRKITELGMKRFISKHLPDCGVFGTADLFRERYDVNPRTYASSFGVGHNEDYEANEKFCNLLDKVASYIDSIGWAGTYDPEFIRRAWRAIREEAE